MTRRQLKRQMTDAVYTFIIKLVFVYPFKLIYYFFKLIYIIIERIVRRARSERYEAYDYDEDEFDDEEAEVEDEQSKYDNLPPLPEMCQIYPIGENTCIGVQFVSMCPDETAHIRIIGDTEFSEIYRRRVYREKHDKNMRYFKLNNQKYYLNNKCTQPIIINQTKIKSVSE